MARHTLASMPWALVLLMLAAGAAASDGDWRTGRATYYGTDGWSIHGGACGLGYQYKDLGTGWDVAAIADASPEFSGSCGRCYEVKCDPRSQVFDGYGNDMDRSDACVAGSASVVVRTVDNCPCVYPGNPYSNKRWCCGDHTDTQGTHFDMSIWAFEKLAPKSQGVAGIKFRRVSCDYQPSDPAPEPSSPTPMPDSEKPKAKGFPGDEYSPGGAQIMEEPLVMRFDESGAAQGAARAAKPGEDTKGEKVVSRGALLAERGGSNPTSPSSSADSSRSGSTATSDLAAALHTPTGSGGAGNGCTDTAPSGSSCQKVKDQKQCDEPWLLSGNHCRATCGRCKLEGASPPPSDKGSSPSDSSATSSPSSSKPSSSSPGKGCTDTKPPGSATCEQQKGWGNCDAEWMSQYKYCSATCGRCSGSKEGVQAYDGKSDRKGQKDKKKSG